MTRYTLCLLLLCASSIVSARDVRMHGANGDGGACNDEAATPIATLAPAKRAPVAARGKAKAPTAFRGGGSDDTGSHTPRWHSFLPGMFR